MQCFTNSRRLPKYAAFALLIAGSAVLAAPDTECTVTLRSEANWFFARTPPATRQEFDRDWGQFEVRIQKRAFPIPAPNCRSDIRLRWIAITPKDRNRQEMLDRRWEQLARLKTLKAAGAGGSPETIKLDLRHYTTTGPAGKTQLAYCNAFAG